MNKNNDTFSLANTHVRVDYNLTQGKYTISDAHGQTVVQGAHLRINEWDSAQPDYRHTADTTAVSDALGQGKKLLITSTAPGKPTLLLEITLYDSEGFVVFNSGLKNTLDKPFQIMDMHPMADAIAFAGRDMSEHFSLLDGNSGDVLTRVRHGDELACDNNLLVTFGPQGGNTSLVFGGLTYHEFEKYVSAKKQSDGLALALYSQDPVGKRVDPGTTYLPDEKYYLDFTIACPFEALEAYARRVKDAQGVKLDYYDFPTICAWFAGNRAYGAGPMINDSPGTVWEMDQVIKRNFQKYTRIAIRLIPDTYTANNQQGWWDDEHWQMHANQNSTGVCLRPPYETTKKWAQAIIDRGGIPLHYCQSCIRSVDYAEKFPGHMLFNDGPEAVMEKKHWIYESNKVESRWGYDYTDPDFVAHMRDVYKNFRDAGVRGWFFDYPESAYPDKGGMEDPYATAAGTYRRMYEIAAEGFGHPYYIHERNLDVGSDITIGVVTSQRTLGDSDRINPAVISIPALRWYKNRVILNIDPESKNPFHAVPDGCDGVRAMFTMVGVASGRVLLANSFSEFTDEHLRIISRVLPMPTTPQTARPIDAFTTDQEYPRVFDFAVNPDWHLLTFYNTAVQEGQWSGDWNVLTHKGDSVVPAPATVSVSLSTPPAFGGLGLDPDAHYYIYDFWNNRMVGKFKGSDELTQNLRPGEARTMAVHKVQPNPQFVSTNRHIMQGYLDMTHYPQWDANTMTLAGTSKVVGGETYKVIIAANGFAAVSASADNARADVRACNYRHNLVELSLDADANQNAAWKIVFGKN